MTRSRRLLCLAATLLVLSAGMAGLEDVGTAAAAVSSAPGEQLAPGQEDNLKYTVKPGDSLLTIAAAFGVKPSALQEANGLADPNLIKAGQVLSIPGGTPQPSAPPSMTPTSTATPTATPAPNQTYTVKPGDGLLSIARSFGVPVSAIQQANGLQDPNKLKVGMVLTIPMSQQPPSTAASATPAAATATPTPTAPPGQTPASTQTPPPSQGPTQPAAATSQSSQDPRRFEETGFRIANDRFWEYFQRRGGVRTFGYPISNEFTLLGFRVQLFQRLLMQLNADGAVTTMNLLDEGLMPYTRINFSTLPGADKGMAAAAPKPGSEAYFDKLLAFVQEGTPNQWNGLPVSFYKTFSETVRFEDAYPDGKQDPGIMPAINLELWGVPTSAPAYDPNNGNFVYQRFQRGILHFDKTTGTTQGLLLGDYLKSILTGWNLPPDLEEQARGSRLYRQYNLMMAGGLNRPGDLPGTDLTGAFGREGLVVLDPGHGGTEVGAAHVSANGPVLIEKHLNLKLAQKTADLLRKAGAQVVLTRNADTQVNNPPRDVTGNGRMTLDDDLEARIDLANNAGAAVLLSIHLNGSNDQNLKGAEVYYNSQRPFGADNKKFAKMVLDNLLANVRTAGFDLQNRGIKEDEAAVGKGNSLYLLGPAGEDKPRAAQMVGALAEAAFLTSDGDAALLGQERFLDAVAAGYAQAIQQWLQSVRR